MPLTEQLYFESCILPVKKQNALLSNSFFWDDFAEIVLPIIVLERSRFLGK